MKTDVRVVVVEFAKGREENKLQDLRPFVLRHLFSHKWKAHFTKGKRLDRDKETNGQ